MTRLPLAFALLAAPAAPALAQDVGAQYLAALDAFLLPTVPDLSIDSLAGDDAFESLLPSLEGDWIVASRLGPSRDALDPSMFDRACEVDALALVATAPHSFELRRSYEKDGETRSLAISHDFIMGNSFDRGVAQANMIDYLGLDSLPSHRPGAFNFFSMRGPVALFHPSPDVLVLVAPVAAPDILVRCP